MSYQIDGIWNTDPATDRLERQREAELDQQDCTGGGASVPPNAVACADKLPEGDKVVSR